MFTPHAWRAAIVLALAGMTCRLLLRHVETRWQIVGFWGVVLVYQLIARPLGGLRISLASAAADIVVVTVAVTAMKFILEGKVWP